MSIAEYVYFEGQKANDRPEPESPVMAMQQMMDIHKTFIIEQHTGLLRPSDLFVVRAIIMRQVER
jgi:hypothetical protein